MFSSVLSFFYRIARIMNCFFGCFRTRDKKFQSQNHLLADHEPSKKIRKAVKAQTPLSFLLLAEEREESLYKDEESHGLGPQKPNTVDNELKDEAKFLKACGAIPETPTEIRETTTHNGNSEPLKFHSWLPNTSIKKLQLDQHFDLSPSTPYQLSEKRGTGSDSNSSLNNGASIKSHANETTPVSHWSSSPTYNHGATKSVRFDCKKTIGDHDIPKPSPFPTPLVITNEMQTPGTTFPQNERIRSQYVYSTMNPMGNLSQLKQVKEEDSPDKPINDPAYLAISMPNPYFGKTPGDRPILGTVAAHWNGDDERYVSPKMWDGNGIPNSTNKYKEDQKVSWHATPFEERLEKALSEESSGFQRKDLNESLPMTLEEDNEENDTAASKQGVVVRV